MQQTMKGVAAIVSTGHTPLLGGKYHVLALVYQSLLYLVIKALNLCALYRGVTLFSMVR